MAGRKAILTEDEVHLLSEITGSEFPVMSKMNDLQLLDIDQCRRAITWRVYITYRTKKKQYTRNQVVAMIEHHFGYDKGFIHKTIAKKGVQVTPCCIRCGKPLIKSIFRNNEGLCDDCVARDIRLTL